MNGEKNGQSGTFVVHISHCENATWQGDVVWAEEKKRKQFRSALELIRLIDDALFAGGDVPGVPLTTGGEHHE